MKDNIQQRLFNFSENPPASAWTRIAEALDEPAFAQKLRAFETTPPANVWEKIQLQLSKPVSTVILLRTKLFKYAIAASVLIVIAAGSIFYLKSRTAPHVATTTPANHSSKETLLKNPSASGNGSSTRQPSYETTELNNSDMAAASNDALIHFSPQVSIAKKSIAPDPITIAPEEKKIEKTNINTELPDRYIIATTHNGKVVRLPKKAYDVYACAETYQNYWCKQKIASIQSKLAASVSTDFTDFIDLLKKLQDNP